MIEVLKDQDGKIIAYCEWTLTDPRGIQTNGGTHIYIYDLWTYKRNGSIPKIIKAIYKKTPTAENVYWVRRDKYPNRTTIYNKRRFSKWAAEKKKQKLPE